MSGEVYRNIARAKPDVIEGLRQSGTANVCEAMGRRNLLSTNLRPIYSGAKIAGSAVTISAPSGDNYMVHVAIEVLQPGDVLVLSPTAPDTHAYFGEMMGLSAKAHGCAGLIIDAGIRDIEDLKTLGFPAWASSICAAGTDRKTLGQVNVPIVCGGINIDPGDIILADDDGVCRVPLAQAEDVLKIAQAKSNREDEIRPRLAQGEPGLDVYDLRSELQQLGIKYL